MGILTRYILREHVGPFFFSFAVITSMLILNFVLQAMRYIIGKGISFDIIVEFIVYNLAWILVLVVPMSLLVAVIMAFGRLSSDNEIAAMKSAGISFYKLLLPVLLAAFIISYGLVEFNDKVLPVAQHKARLLKKSIKLKKPTMSIQPGVFVSGIDRYSLIIDDKDELSSEVYGVTIFDQTTRYIVRTISARKGEIEIDRQNEDMILTLSDGEIHEVNLRKNTGYHKVEFSTHRITIPVQNLTLKKKNEDYRSDKEKNISQLLDEAAKHRHQRNKRLNSLKGMLRSSPELVGSLSPVQKEQLVQVLFEHSIFDHLSNWIINLKSTDLTHQIDSPLVLTKSELLLIESQIYGAVTETQLRAKKSSPDMNGKKINMLKQKQKHGIQQLQKITGNLSSARNYQRLTDQLLVEVNKKYSIPFACLVFVLLGVPIGIKVKKGNLGIAGGISLFFFIAYYFCLVLGEDYADRESLNPFLAMWFPNMLLGFVGVVLILQTASEKSFGLHRLHVWLYRLLVQFFQGKRL